MVYTVKYRKCGSWFWNTLKDIKGDGTLMQEGLAVRVFIKSDESRIEVPCLNNEFIFSSGRYTEVLKNQEKEAGQKLPIN